MSLLGNITALGVLASVAGGAWAGLLPGEAEKPAMQTTIGEDAPELYLELDLIAVPLIVDSRINGYLLARLLVQVNEAEAKRFDLNLEAYLTDAIYRHLIATTASLDTKNTYSIFDESADGLLEKVNTELGVQMVDSVTIAQFDILQNDAVLMDNKISAPDSAAQAK